MLANGCRKRLICIVFLLRARGCCGLCTSGHFDCIATGAREIRAAADGHRDLGYDTNFTWLEARSGHLDKRPALEYLIGIDRHSGAYIPELAEKWEMSPDGKTWRITLRKGVKFHDNWGEFTAKDVRHTVFRSPSLNPFRLMPAPGVH